MTIPKSHTSTRLAYRLAYAVLRRWGPSSRAWDILVPALPGCVVDAALYAFSRRSPACCW